MRRAVSALLIFAGCSHSTAAFQEDDLDTFQCKWAEPAEMGDNPRRLRVCLNSAVYCVQSARGDLACFDSGLLFDADIRD